MLTSGRSSPIHLLWYTEEDRSRIIAVDISVLAFDAHYVVISVSVFAFDAVIGLFGNLIALGIFDLYGHRGFCFIIGPGNNALITRCRFHGIGRFLSICMTAISLGSAMIRAR